MYEGLLLSTGGGIITDIKKSAYQGEPIIIIGLGGTGIDALKAVRKRSMRIFSLMTLQQQNLSTSI